MIIIQSPLYLRYLAERLLGDKAHSSSERSSMRKGRRDSNTSVASTLSQLGEGGERTITWKRNPCQICFHNISAANAAILHCLNLNFRTRGSLDAGELLQRHLVNVRLRQESLLLRRRRQPPHFCPLGRVGRRRQLCLQPRLPARDHRRRLAAVVALRLGGSGLSPHALRTSVAGGKATDVDYWYYFTVRISGFFLLLSYCDSRMSR